MSKVSISGELSLQEPQLHQLRKREFAQKSWESQSQSRCFLLDERCRWFIGHEVINTVRSIHETSRWNL